MYNTQTRRQIYMQDTDLEGNLPEEYNFFLNKVFYFFISAVQDNLTSWNSALLWSNSKWSVCGSPAVLQAEYWQHRHINQDTGLRGTFTVLNAAGLHVPIDLCEGTFMRQLEAFNTVISDQYWLKFYFHSRLKSFTLGICKWGHRKSFLPV